MAVEDIVAKDQRTRPSPDKVRADMEGLCKAFGLGLLRVGQVHAEICTIAEHPLELERILGRGDDQDIADAGQHQGAERIVDHRLVEDRHKLLGYTAGKRIEPGSRTPCQYDPASRHLAP